MGNNSIVYLRQPSSVNPGVTLDGIDVCRHTVVIYVVGLLFMFLVFARRGNGFYDFSGIDEVLSFQSRDYV